MRRKQLRLDHSLQTDKGKQYSIDFEERRKAMQAIVGMWKDRSEFEDPEAYIRNVRRDTRLKRLNSK